MNKTLQLSRLVNPGVDELSPYQPGKPVSELARELGLNDVVKLASNENPLGPSSAVLAALQTELFSMNRYPDGAAFDLKAAIAAKNGVSADCVTLGNGSNDILELVARCFLRPGREAVFSKHSFAIYPLVTLACGATGIEVPAGDGKAWALYGHDLQAMAKSVTDKTAVVFIANPNNPTGTYVPEQALYTFISHLPESVICLVDEAYFEYVDKSDYPNAVKWINEFPNLLVTRTFSKAYGLAGLRVGYSISQPELANYLNRVRQPFNVNSMAQAAAVAALQDDAYIRQSVELNQAGMLQLNAGLEQLGCSIIPSVGNFVCVDVGRDGGAVFQALLLKGVIVRPVANYDLPNHLRVSIGTGEENSRFLAALADVLNDDS